MPEFKLISQEDVNNHSQGISLSEFRYSDEESISETELVDSFIHSKSFTEDSRRECIKNYTGDGSFLRQLFEIDLVELRDFKTLDKKGIIQFLNNFDELDDLGEKEAVDFDKNIFFGLKDKFLELSKAAQFNNFYLISKKWFDRNDVRIRQVEYDNFVYYFLIIWTDETNKTLSVCEWTFD